MESLESLREMIEIVKNKNVCMKGGGGILDRHKNREDFLRSMKITNGRKKGVNFFDLNQRRKK